MIHYPRFSVLLAVGVLLCLAFSPAHSAMQVDPEEGFEFTLPREVAGHATLTLTNTGGGVLQYGITSTISEGFRGQYYQNRSGASPAFGQLIFERQDANINFNWQANGPQNGVTNDSFGVRWEGIFIAPEAGRYAFRTNSDEGVKLFIDGQRRINDWVNHNARVNDWAENLSFGPHRIKLEYYEDRNNAIVQFFWQPPGQQQPVIMPGRSEKGWITFSNSHGNVGVGDPVEIDVTINTRNLQENGEYVDTILVSSNDRDNPVIRIPVTVFVTPWQPGAVEPSDWGIARNMQPNTREQVQLVLRSVGRGNYDYTATIEGNDRGWLTVSPNGGSIGPGLESALTLNFNATARGQGIYNVTLVLTGNDELNPVIRIPMTMAIGMPFGTVFGRVASLQGGAPVAGANVGLLGYGYVSTTDENGAFELAAPVHQYQLWATAENYLRFESDNFDVAENGRTEVNAALRVGSFVPGLFDLQLFLAPEDTMIFPLAVRNRGNGTVTWHGDIEFPPEHRARQWDERLRFNISREGLDDNRINGVEFVDGHFYVSGGNEGRGFGKIYVFDADGGFVRDFDQFLEGTQFGMRDLAWDGRLLWGSDAGIVYGFDLEGNLETQFRGPIGECRAMTFDPATGVLWICDSRGILYRVDREGRVVEQLADPGERKFGLAWYAQDPDGFPLYMFTNDNANHVIAVRKYSPNTHEMRLVADLVGTPTDRAGGLAIAGNWDPYSWSLIAQMNAAVDAIAVYHMSSRTDWISLPVANGTIDGGQSTDIEVRFNSVGLINNQQYDASVHFTHDGQDGEAIVDIHLNVGQEGGVAQRLLPLERGWNLVSTNVLAEGREDFVTLMSPLTEAGTLVLAKDGNGNFFWPDRDFDNIGSWNELEGYWLKVSENTQMTFIGEMVPMDTPISLDAGWNTVSYLPRIPASPDVVLGGLADNLVIARNGTGRFYLPAYNFSDMEAMRQGEGYQLRVNEAADLVYTFNGGASVQERRYSSADLDWLQALPSTGLMHNLLVLTSLESGTRLEAITPSGTVGGRGVVGSDGLAGVTLWGDDPTTIAIDGFQASQAPVIRVSGTATELKFTIKEGSPNWSDGGMGVVELTGSVLPTEFAISSAYPNPFNSTLHITFSLTESGITSLKVFDLAGREAGMLITANLRAGVHRAEWNADGLPSGIYMLKLESGAKKVSQKVLLLK